MGQGLFFIYQTIIKLQKQHIIRVQLELLN